MLAPDFVETLRCPRSKEPLLYFPRGERNEDEADAFLFAPSARLRYRIDAGVPVLLRDEATEVTERDAARLVERARALGLDSGRK